MWLWRIKLKLRIRKRRLLKTCSSKPSSQIGNQVRTTHKLFKILRIVSNTGSTLQQIPTKIDYYPQTRMLQNTSQYHNLHRSYQKRRHLFAMQSEDNKNTILHQQKKLDDLLDMRNHIWRDLKFSKNKKLGI